MNLLAGRRPPPLTPRSGIAVALVALAAAAMCFLGVIALLGARAADAVASDWTADLAATGTVRVGGPVAGRGERAAAALAALETTPGIGEARRLGARDLDALLAPWLGPGLDLSGLPAPELIEVTLDGAPFDAAGLQLRLDAQAPGAVWDDHGSWRADVASAASTLRDIAAVWVAVAAFTMAAMVATSARASLAAAAPVVRTLRLIGAEDRAISRAFERAFALRALLGGAVGAAAALLAAAQMPEAWVVAAPGAGGGLDEVDAALALAAPLGAGLVAWVATRVSVLIELRRS